MKLWWPPKQQQVVMAINDSCSSLFAQLQPSYALKLHQYRSIMLTCHHFRVQCSSSSSWGQVARISLTSDFSLPTWLIVCRMFILRPLCINSAQFYSSRAGKAEPVTPQDGAREVAKNYSYWADNLSMDGRNLVEETSRLVGKCNSEPILLHQPRVACR